MDPRVLIALAVVLTASGTAQAQSVANVWQNGDENRAFVDQTSSVGGNVTISQYGNQQTASFIQSGRANAGDIDQYGHVDSDLRVEQSGDGNYTFAYQYYGGSEPTYASGYVRQEGTANTAHFYQSGGPLPDVYGRVFQQGSNNYTGSSQYFGGNLFDAVVIGDGNSFSLRMLEGNTTTAVQNGNENVVDTGWLWGGTIVLGQYGNSNEIAFNGELHDTYIADLSLEQHGDLNAINVDLNDESGTLRVTQYGNRNAFNARVQGDGNEIVGTSVGDGNRVELDLLGDENLVSLKQSGIDNLIDASLHANTAELSISQSGAANVTQVALLDGAASIGQTGNGNVANVQQVTR